MQPRSRWVYENTGSKGCFTKSAAESRALWSSLNLFSFRTGFGEIFGLRTVAVGFWAVSKWKSLIGILCGSGKRLVVDRIRLDSRLNDALWGILWWLFTLKWVSGKFELRNHSRGTHSRFLLKTVSIAINSQYLDKNTSWMILGRFEVGSICHLVCDAFDSTLGRQTHLRIFWDTFCFEMCFKRLWG